MVEVVRVMTETGRKRAVASAFDWPGWDRSARIGHDVLAVLEAYRPRYAPVAALAGFGEGFAAAGPLEVVEQLEGTGMGDFYGTSGRTAAPEQEAMTEADCERKLGLLLACWTFFDELAARPSELRLGPRGGGRDRNKLIRHVHGSALLELAPKVGISMPLDMAREVVQDPDRLRAHQVAFCDAIREHNARGPWARTWTVQFLIRRYAYHLLDHAWEMEDRDPSPA